MGNQDTLTVIPFGPFEADLHAQELRKLGVRLRLPRQSFQILKMLLEHSGELVTREDLRLALWPSDTFVDFEHGLNAAINRLRETLGDDADNPKFVETLPRRGYRFISPLSQSGLVSPTPQAAPVQMAVTVSEEKTEKALRPRWLKIGKWVFVAAALIAILIFAYSRWRKGQASAPATLSTVRFTAYPGAEHYPTFSPDGSQIAFSWDGDPPPGATGYDLYVKVVGSEQLLRLTSHPSDFLGEAWSPDGTQIAFHRFWHGGKFTNGGNPASAENGLYVIPSLGGVERKLRSTRLLSRYYVPISWSPDGKWIAFSDLSPSGEGQRLFPALHRNPGNHTDSPSSRMCR